MLCLTAFWPSALRWLCYAIAEVAGKGAPYTVWLANELGSTMFCMLRFGAQGAMASSGAGLCTIALHVDLLLDSLSASFHACRFAPSDRCCVPLHCKPTCCLTPVLSNHIRAGSRRVTDAGVMRLAGLAVTTQVQGLAAQGPAAPLPPAFYQQLTSLAINHTAATGGRSRWKGQL